MRRILFQLLLCGLFSGCSSDQKQDSSSSPKQNSASFEKIASVQFESQTPTSPAKSVIGDIPEDVKPVKTPESKTIETIIPAVGGSVTKEDILPVFDGLSGEIVTAPVSESKKDSTAAAAMPENQELFCRFSKPFFRGSELRTSKWGIVGLVQKKLGLEVDGVFGPATQAALSSYRAENNLPKGDCIDVALYRKILPEEPLPDYQDRALALTFLMEGTDYDKIEYNYGSKDPSGMTWGPMGMTLNSGEIQSILRAAIAKDPTGIKSLAGDSGWVFLQGLSSMSGGAAMSYVRNNYWNMKGKQRQFVLDVFKRIANSAIVRQEFDNVATRTCNMRFRHYRNFLKTQSGVTEIDWAMFWDVAVQTGNAQKKAKGLAGLKVDNKTGAEKRKIWGDYIASQVSKAWQADRRKRNETFYDRPDIMKAYGLGERSIEL